MRESSHGEEGAALIVVLVLAGLAVLVGVVVVAMGRGGELAEVHPDHPPLPWPPGDRPVDAGDVLHLRLPRGIWGYQAGITDEALAHLADELQRRDERIAHLEKRLAEPRRQMAAPGENGHQVDDAAWRPSDPGPEKDDDEDDDDVDRPADVAKRDD